MGRVLVEEWCRSGLATAARAGCRRHRAPGAAGRHTPAEGVVPVGWGVKKVNQPSKSEIEFQI